MTKQGKIQDLDNWTKNWLSKIFSKNPGFLDSWTQLEENSKDSRPGILDSWTKNELNA